MILPILISVSVAPVSYFFCASAPLLDAANTANAAAETIAILLMVNAIMMISLFFNDVGGVCHGFLDRKLLVTPACRLPFCRDPHNKKPPARRARGCFFSSKAVRLA